MSTCDYDYSVQYTFFHDRSDEHARRMTRIHKGILEQHLPPPGPGPVLDVGCGFGFSLLALRELGFPNVRGVDVDAGQVAQCRARGLPVQLVEDTARYLQEHAGGFETILMLDVLEHILVGDQIPTLRALHGALAEGGRCILTVPNANAAFAMRWRYNDHTHYTSFTEHSLRFVLLNAGFRRVNIPSGPLSWRPPLAFWRREFRRGFWRWVFRKLWSMALDAEIGEHENIETIPLDLNLRAVAYK